MNTNTTQAYRTPELSTSRDVYSDGGVYRYIGYYIPSQNQSK